MKKTTKLSMFLAALLLTVLTTITQAQSASTTQPRYKEIIGENPTAEADIKVTTDFINALVSGDLDKAKTLMPENYTGYGPSPADSSNKETEISEWQQNYKTQSNRKVSFVSQTFQVKLGDLKGNWVTLWGDYSFTQNGKDVKFPFQYTARVANGKIETSRIYYDRLFILQTLGYKVTPPENNK